MVFILHGSATAGVTTIIDLTGAARIIASRHCNPFGTFIAVGIIYSCITFTRAGDLKLLEQHW